IRPGWRGTDPSPEDERVHQPKAGHSLRFVGAGTGGALSRRPALPDLRGTGGGTRTGRAAGRPREAAGRPREAAGRPSRAPGGPLGGIERQGSPPGGDARRPSRTSTPSAAHDTIQRLSQRQMKSVAAIPLAATLPPTFPKPWSNRSNPLHRYAPPF